jgi:hypothetical protein
MDTGRAAGAKIDQLAVRLQTDGAAAFSTAWNDLLVSIQTKLTT